MRKQGNLDGRPVYLATRAHRQTFHIMSRPRFRFSLRTLLVVVTIVACWLGWEGHYSAPRPDPSRVNVSCILIRHSLVEARPSLRFSS